MKKFPKIFYSIFIGWSLSAFGFGILLPYISVFFLKAFNLGAGDLGVFFLLTFTLRSIVQAYTGNISDIYGRKKVILFSLFGRFFFLSLIAVLLYFKAPLPMILISVSISFIMSAIFQPVAQAAVSDYLPKNTFLHGMSLIRVGGNIGWMVGPILGGYINENSFEILFLVSGIFSLLGGLIFYFHFHDLIIRKEIESSREPFVKIFQDKLFMTICIAVFLLMITVSQMLSTLPFFLSKFKNVSSEQIGYIFAVNGATVLLFQITITKISSSYNTLVGIVIGSVLYGIGYFFWGFLEKAGFFYLLLFCISFAEVVTTPLLANVTKKLSNERTVGRYMGFFGLVATTGWSIGPMVGSAILEAFEQNHKIAWILISGFAFTAGLIFFTINQNLKKSKNFRLE